MKRILVIAGTRPEAIKLAPVVHELRRRELCRVILCATAQHRQMLDQVLEIFELKPDMDLDLMTPGQSLSDLTARLFEKLPAAIRQARADCVVVQGDTTTAFASAVSAFYERVPVAHVEAGLRTRDIYAPFPEEVNRRLVAQVARWHFAPTERARQNLLREGIAARNIYVTGNTVVDALLAVVPTVHGLPDHLQPPPGSRLVLVTGHRRESFGAGMRQICEALAEIAAIHPDAYLVYPVHPNPNVLEPVNELLGNIPNVRLVEPVDYPTFIALMMEAHFIISDSGGVQEEAPALGKPVLVTREITERPEAVEAGCARLVGPDKEAIVRAARELLDNPQVYARMAQAKNPFGDGHAAEQIASVLEHDLLIEG